LEISKIILDYIKVLTTSQIIYGAIVLTLLFLFKEAIRTLIGRIAKIKLPGGGELSTPQSLRASEDKPSEVEISIPSENLLPSNFELASEQVKEIDEVLKLNVLKLRFGNIVILIIFLFHKLKGFLIGYHLSAFGQQSLCLTAFGCPLFQKLTSEKRLSMHFNLII